MALIGITIICATWLATVVILVKCGFPTIKRDEHHTEHVEQANVIDLQNPIGFADNDAIQEDMKKEMVFRDIAEAVNAFIEGDVK
jgi:hypothetical protein